MDAAKVTDNSKVLSCSAYYSGELCLVAMTKIRIVYGDFPPCSENVQSNRSSSLIFTWATMGVNQQKIFGKVWDTIGWDDASSWVVLLL